MKHKHSYEPQSGKFIRQIHLGTTLASDLHLGHYRDRWKGLINEYNIENFLHHGIKSSVP